jgi:hypothetical protein
MYANVCMNFIGIQLPSVRVLFRIIHTTIYLVSTRNSWCAVSVKLLVDRVESISSLHPILIHVMIHDFLLPSSTTDNDHSHSFISSYVQRSSEDAEKHITMLSRLRLHFSLLLFSASVVSSFVVPVSPPPVRNVGRSDEGVVCWGSQKTVEIETTLDDEKVTSLFAWVSRAFAGEPEYNNLMLAVAAIFGNLPEDSMPLRLLEDARSQLPPEEKPVGDSFSIEDREHSSLGAMGAGQWMGQFRTRPHALLKLNSTFETVDDWVKTLPRGCRRTIKKALAQNFTVTAKPILADKPAPHSTLAAFRCVVAHEVRLLSYDVEGFLDALAEAVSRYMGTTRMTGEIREYRNEQGKVIAIGALFCLSVVPHLMCRLKHFLSSICST